MKAGGAASQPAQAQVRETRVLFVRKGAWSGWSHCDGIKLDSMIAGRNDGCAAACATAAEGSDECRRQASLSVRLILKQRKTPVSCSGSVPSQADRQDEAYAKRGPITPFTSPMSSDDLDDDLVDYIIGDHRTLSPTVVAESDSDSGRHVLEVLQVVEDIKRCQGTCRVTCVPRAASNVQDPETKFASSGQKGLKPVNGQLSSPDSTSMMAAGCNRDNESLGSGPDSPVYVPQRNLRLGAKSDAP
jgi:hypothetical protein